MPLLAPRGWNVTESFHNPDNRSNDGGTRKLLVDSITAAEMIQISPRLLWDLTKREVVPSRRIGRCRRYSVAELQEWIARGCPRSVWVPTAAANHHRSAYGEEVGGG